MKQHRLFHKNNLKDTHKPKRQPTEILSIYFVYLRRARKSRNKRGVHMLSPFFTIKGMRQKIGSNNTEKVHYERVSTNIIYNTSMIYTHPNAMNNKTSKPLSKLKVKQNK